MKRMKQSPLIQGRAKHRRTERDYVSVLLDEVTLDDWREVVNGAKEAAKSGDAQARAWLAKYLMGKPTGIAPSPMTLVVQQLNGIDPLVERLSKPLIDRQKYPSLFANQTPEAQIRASVAAELMSMAIGDEGVAEAPPVRLAPPSITK